MPNATIVLISALACQRHVGHRLPVRRHWQMAHIGPPISQRPLMCRDEICIHASSTEGRASEEVIADRNSRNNGFARVASKRIGARDRLLIVVVPIHRRIGIPALPNLRAIPRNEDTRTGP